MANENELYEAWRIATPEQRKEAEQELYEAVRKHARAVVGTHLREVNDALVSDIASHVMERLSTFRGESKFSTWVHSIAQNQVNEELRDRTYHRELFDDSRRIDAEEGDGERMPGKMKTLPPNQEHSVMLHEVAAGASPAERALMEGMSEGKDQNELARHLGITPDAAESRRRRFRAKHKKKFL